MTKPELLAPAGNLHKLKLAFYYGADAVYVGGKSFSLRTFADNFTDEELAEGIAYAHARGKKVYVAVNIFARNADFERLTEYFRTLERLGADAVLISDLGVFRACRKAAPDLPIHISTQANTTNSQSAAMWKELGASRVVLARELSLEEIAKIHEENPGLELEAFVHGISTAAPPTAVPAYRRAVIAMRSAPTNAKMTAGRKCRRTKRGRIFSTARTST